jgi:hypothetical protein
MLGWMGMGVWMPLVGVGIVEDTLVEDDGVICVRQGTLVQTGHTCRLESPANRVKSPGLT